MKNSIFIKVILGLITSVLSFSKATASCAYSEDSHRIGVFRILKIEKATFEKSLPSDFIPRGCHIKIKPIELVSSQKYLKEELDIFDNGNVCSLQAGKRIEGTIVRPCCDTPGTYRSDEQLACLNRHWIILARKPIDDIKNDKRYLMLAERKKNASYCFKIKDGIESMRCFAHIRDKIENSLQKPDDIQSCETLKNPTENDQSVARCVGKLAEITGYPELCEKFKASDEFDRSSCLILSKTTPNGCKSLKRLKDVCFYQTGACDLVKDLSRRESCWIHFTDKNLDRIGERQYQKICEAMSSEEQTASCLVALLRKAIISKKSYSSLEMINQSRVNNHLKDWIIHNVASEVQRIDPKGLQEFCEKAKSYNPKVFGKKCLDHN